MMSSTANISRLGIPAFDFSTECLHGVAARGSLVATVFPQSLGLGASFDPDLVQQIAQAIGDEARAINNAGNPAYLSCWGTWYLGRGRERMEKERRPFLSYGWFSASDSTEHEHCPRPA